MVITIRLTPNASKNEILHPDATGCLKIKVTAKPIEGEANAALIELLAEALDVSKSAINIRRGETSRNKVVEIAGIQSLPENIYGKSFR
jgi:uncharacterized protein